jgi:dissimilatory sulfite reductase related protein
MISVEVDGDGFLKNMGDWDESVMYELAAQDGMTLTEEHIKYIKSAREYYDEFQSVPVIRTFAQEHGMDRKASPLYDLFETGPMKRIAKYGGLPKPTGCV